MAELTVDDGIRLRRAAGIRSIRLGDTKVSYVPDGDVRLRPRPLLQATTDEVWDAHPEYLDSTGHLVGSVGGLLVEHGDRALLIDTGFGPQTLEAPDGPLGTIHGGALPHSLAELGRRPEDIEAVAFTHLHSDHTGWACHPAPGSDQPVFTHAEYLISEQEWARRDLLEAQGMTEQVAALAPRVRTITDGQEIFPGVHVRITPGHTVGHAEYVITGGGRRLIAFGDAVHSPIQIDHPEWSSAFDHDPALTADHRRRLVAELAEPDTIGFGVHFADVVFGHVRQSGNGPAWRPLDA
ncbi:MBL fold metallo-hydrolase [Streptomyces sp. NBC_00513]|uniref:MBL fold metallo-hydrolase n=1 Tax=unclassified Streptomyces TaxID=2593676 RepID=UPI00225917F4|nr:MBL fold metallo-hydrolase [Streptomyces sp. NBC_00424]MCX5071530.1 MBL fold metallo-hydrolase [Streptomyces sp. NBC_00424]WUD45071.1 MBL fold metallo-hydrolase [Streptomyces sp. NBC_00513]